MWRLIDEAAGKDVNQVTTVNYVKRALLTAVESRGVPRARLSGHDLDVVPILQLGAGDKHPGVVPRLVIAANLIE